MTKQAIMPVNRSAPVTVARPLPKQTIHKVAESVLADMWRAIYSLLNEPVTLAIFVVSFGLIVGHVTAANTSIIASTVTWLNKYKFTNVATWVNTNAVRVIGAIAFAPAIASVPKSVRTATAIFITVWLLFVREHSPIQYVLQAVALRLFFKVRDPSSRVIVMSLVVAAHVYGVADSITKSLTGT